MHYLQDRIWHLYQQIKTGPKSKFGPIFFTKKVTYIVLRTAMGVKSQCLYFAIPGLRTLTKSNFAVSKKALKSSKKY